MAAPIIITVGLNTADARLAAQQLAAELRTALNGIQQQSQRAGRGIGTGLTGGLSGILQSYRQFASSASGILSSIGLATSFAAIAKASIDAAVQIDKSRQTIAALTGSVENANIKLRQLRELSQRSPGVTTQLAADLFAQFKALGDVTDSTIERVTKSIGRLNAVFGLVDPAQFARNLSQIFAQSFERSDIKEALGQVPIFEQLLQQAFGQNAEGLRKLKEAGKLTREQFLLGISEAVDRDPNLAKISESLGTRLAKSFEQLKTRLEPVGLFILNILTPVVVALESALAKFEPELKSILENILGVIKAFGSFYQTINQIIPIGKIVETTIKGMALLFAFLRDSVEISIAKIELRLGSLISTTRDALAAVGVEFESLNRLADRFASRRAQNEQRVAQGFINEQKALAAIRGQLADANVPTAATAQQGLRTQPGVTSDSTKQAEEARKRIEETRRFQESLLRLEQERVEQTARLLNAETETRTRALKAQFNAGLIEYQAYYAQLQGLEERRTAIQAETIAAQTELIKREIGQLEQARSTARGAERVDIERQLLQLYTEQRIKVDELTEALNLNTQAAVNRVKTTVQLAGGDVRGPQLSVIETPVAPGASPQQIAEAGLLDLRRQQVVVENQIEQGILNQADGRRQINEILRQERDLRQSVLLAELKQMDLAPERRAQIQLELESIRNLGVELTAAQRFMRGFGSEVDSVGDAFERLGQNLSRSFANVKGLLGNLKQSITQFFRDLLGQGIQRVFQQIFGSITNAIFGGIGSSTARSSGGGGAGGALAGIAGAAAGGIFGGGGGGGIGGIFGGGGGGGFLTPGFGGGFPSIGGFTGPSSAGPPSGASIGGQLGGLGGLAGLFRGPGSLFRGFGFGRAAGSARGPLAAIAPLLGAQLGAGLGGRSRLGQILGGVGGAALGIGITAAPAILATGGSLGFLGLGGLFSNPITAGVGAALLVGSILLGRSQQRRSDEQQSGVFLQDAVTQIGQLRDQVRSGQLPLSQARQIFESQILATFISNIQTLKTKSVRESRLTNQVRDLRNLFDSTVASQASTGAKVNAVNDRLIPEFAMGGIVPGIDRGYDSVMARVRPGEMVLTRGQQSAIQGLAGPGVFRAAGVPEAAQMSARGPLFANGGMLRTLSQPALVNTPYGTLTGRGSDQPVTLDVSMNLVVGREDATRLVVSGQTTSAGQRAVVGIVRKAILEREF